MTAVELLREARVRGLELRPDGAELVIRPAARLTAELREALISAKPEILRLLSPPIQHALGGAEPAEDTLTAAEVAAMPLADFATAGLVLTVRSKVLNEVVLFASDNTVIEPGERRPVYRARELEALGFLSALDPKGLRAIHALKATFKGEVVA